MSRSLTVIALGAWLAGCGSLDHTNPFDPSTPASAQAKATLVGDVSKEALTTPPVLSGVHVSIPGTSFGADTDADGHYAIAGVPQGSYAVQAVASGYDIATVTGIAVSLDDGGHTVDVPPIALAIARGSVTGSVSAASFSGLAPGSSPLSGALVSLDGLPGAVTTDGSGSFLITGVPEDIPYSVTVSKLGFLNTTGPTVTVTGGQVFAGADVTMPWDPGGVDGGLLVQGAPDSGGVTVRVKGLTLVGSPFEATTTSAPDGRWGLVGLVPAGDYNITYELSNYAVIASSTSVGPHTTTTLPGVTLVRDTGGVTGVATLQGSGDSSGIQVSLSPQGTGTVAGAAITDVSGIWHVNALPVGLYDVAYSKTGYGAQAGTILVVSNTVVTTTPVTLLTVPGVLRGRCLLEGLASGALGGTAVSVVGATGVTTTTASDGTWVLNNVGAGAQTVAFDRSTYDSQHVQVVTSPGGDLTLLDVTLARSRGGLSGTFTLAGAASSSGVVVTASGPSSASTVTDATGAFSLAGLPVGTYSVTARRDPTYQPVTVSGVVVASGLTTTLPGSPVSMALLTTGSIAGAVTVERGSPASVTASLSGFDPNGAVVTRSVQTNGTGNYSIASLPNGTYSLTFSKASYDPVTLAGLVVTGAAVAAPAASLLVSKGTIAGLVALTAGAVPGFAVGADFSGVVVTLTGTDVPVPSAVTDPSGNYRFTGVPVSLAGTAFTVTARKTNFQSASTSVTGVGNATVTVGTTLSLPVNAGSLAGTALLWDNVANGGQNATSAGISVQVSGSAFNGTSYAVSPSPTSGATGAWSVPAIPPGTYNVVLTSTNRTCASGGTAVVAEGAAVTMPGSVRCQDAVAPGTMALGSPTPPAGAQPGYTTSTSVSVPVATPATDATAPTSNFRGYQTAIGAAPDWTSAPVTAGQPASLSFTLPAVDGGYTLWARAVDWIGNAGPAASASVVLDTAAPPVPAVATARSQVNDTTAGVTLSGSDSSPNFLQYEACVGTSAAPGTACAAAPTCTPVATPSSFAASLTVNQRNCVWARARDKAGNASGIGLAEIVSDLVPPAGPIISPLYDPTSLTIHADYADFFVTSPATDGPAGGAAWTNVAWVEVNTGSGFSPVCPQASCHPGNVYAPCSCGCADARLVCRDGALYAFRVPLLGGTANSVAVRSVDVAGNVGSGAQQSVPVAGQNFQVTATAYDEGHPRVRGRIMVFKGAPTASSNYNAVRLVDLGLNEVYDAFDTSCVVSGDSLTNGAVTSSPAAEPLSGTAVVYADTPTNSLRVRRAGADGLFCVGGDDTTTVLKTIATPYPWISILSASMNAAGTREQAAWFEVANGGSGTIYVRNGGANNVLDAADPDVTAATVGAGLFATVLQISGDTLVYGTNNSSLYNYATAFTVLNAIGGSFASGTATTWTPPATTRLAALDELGAALAYYGVESGVPTVHVRYPGADGRYGTADDVDVARTFPAPGPTDGGIVIRGGHVVLTEASGSGAKYIDHWYAGADGRFGTSDDTFAQVLPSATARYWPALGSKLSGGMLYVQSGISGHSGDNGDVLGVDLSTMRWDVAGGAAPSQGPYTNGTGTIFYTDSGNTLHARTSDGRETTLLGTSVASPFDADGSNLFVGVGTAVRWYQPDASGQFFTAGAPAFVQIATATGSAYLVAAGAGRAIMRDSSTAIQTLLEPNPTLATPLQVSLDNKPAGYGSWFGGAAVSSSVAAWGCIGPSPNFLKQICMLESVDGVYGNVNDAASVFDPPTAIPIRNLLAIAVSGQRMAFVADGVAGPHLFLVDAGPDGRISTYADNVMLDLGPLPDGRVGGIDLAGDVLAYSTDLGSTNGQQIILFDFLKRTQRVMTTHYSAKPRVVVDASGRATWIDQVFATSAVFVFGP